MAACNGYYYATRDPLGARGDFTTAPEISQMFGEMVGAALGYCWTRAGAPGEAIYVELGPGRGTLAADALRVLRPAGFSGAVHFIETSPVLREAQRELHPYAEWHESLETLPDDRPLLLVGNEFFDSLPVRQFVEGIERKVVLGPAGLAFDRDGEIVEQAPAREAVARHIGELLAARGGVALIVDYGHSRSSPGDTLQAVRSHRYAAVLHDPGEQDLTAHVDFEALARAASAGGAEMSEVVTQGGWLERAGIRARADALARANPEKAEAIRLALDRLVGADAMGELFKVMALHSSGWPRPAGFE
ncbi:MAG TPA: SAM-dependent methyltransferase [Sphingomicrobium sp.]|nr:SAM-dependent methyltransferase [Sphingomicrobium sp.]